MSEKKQGVATQTESMVSYKAAGQDVKLSFSIVRNYLTRGDTQVSDQEVVNFMSLCKYNELNPFLNEAYLVKFGTKPATMIVSKEALLKRAESNPHYDGIKGGVIVLRKGESVELEGCFYLPGDQLVGGWAKVYRDDRQFPAVARVRLDEYDKKQALWNEKKATMIAKVAKVHALREAFPSQIGALYVAEEHNVEDARFEEVSSKLSAGKVPEEARKVISLEEAAPEDMTEEQATDPEQAPVREPAPEPIRKIDPVATTQNDLFNAGPGQPVKAKTAPF